MSQRFEGKNLEEALENAGRALDVERYQLDYHVVLEKRGFLGGTKRVVIEAEIDENAQPPSVAAMHDSISRPQVSSTGARPPRRRKGHPDGAGRDRTRKPRRQREERHFETVELPQGVPVPEQGPESEPARTVREWSEKLAELAGLSLEFRTAEDGEAIRLNCFGPDAASLASRDGELIDSLQVLVNKSLIGFENAPHVEVDCLGFKDRRAEALVQRARDLADLVREGGAEQLLPAMSPVERRIIHVALQDDEDVTTESRGDGFYKRVAIVLRHEAGAPAGP